jgi:HlyD family secretion protein
MPKLDSSLVTLGVAALLASAVGVAVTMEPWKALRDNVDAAKIASAAQPTSPAVAAAPQGRAPWVASAPGRVEPRGGEVRIGPQTAGRVVQVAARMNELVRAGDVLVKLDDADLFTRHAAIDAEVGVRKRERDLETIPRGAGDRRIAEDAVATAERAVFQARLDADATIELRRTGKATSDEVAKAQDTLAAQRDKLEQERVALRKAQAQQGVPLPTRLEAALTGSRSELSLAESAIERTRIRAPFDGAILQVNAKVGETVAPAAELPLIVFGDISRLQARAEVEERDVAKIRLGQRVVIRSDAYPGREFEGQVSTLAQSLAAPRLSSRGPRRPSDVDVLEVVVNLDGQPPVLPGMRVDVFFKPDATVQTGPVGESTGRPN